MTPKAREYLTKAEQYVRRAKEIRNQEDREWQLCLARAYRMLAEVEESGCWPTRSRVICHGAAERPTKGSLKDK